MCFRSYIFMPSSEYEMNGQVCSLSTGEIIKVIGLKIVKVKAMSHELIEGNNFSSTVELPLDYPGFFKLLVDPYPYTSFSDIIKSIKIGDNHLGRPHFRSNVDILVNDVFVKEGEHIVLNSLVEINEKAHVNCTVVKEGRSKTLRIPLSFKGTFYECEDDQFYTLKEIVEWKLTKHRRRIVKPMKTTAHWEGNPYSEHLQSEMCLFPVYEIQAMMKFQEDIVHIPSNLDVEVKDITETYDLNSFVQPLSLNYIFERRNEDFPLLAEIIEWPHCQHIYKSLNIGKQIVVHSKYISKTVIASENRSDLNKKHFLIPKSYKGQFKRRPREFPTVYDLELALKNNESLHVIAMKEFVSEYAELASVCVGDQFLVHYHQSIEVSHKGEKWLIEAVACEKIAEKDHEKVFLPTYMEGNFVEVIHDKKQYDISDICKQFSLPFNVKVSMRDLSINDNLVAFPSLRIEEEIADPCLLISLFDSPSECFRIPVQRESMTIHVIQGQDAHIPCPTPKTIVEEISKDIYYMLRRYENSTLLPPPRPPKKPQSPIVPSTTMRLLPPQPRKQNPPQSPKNSPTGMPRNKASSQDFIHDVTANSENITLILPEEQVKERIRPSAPTTDTRRLKATSLAVGFENLDLFDKYDNEYINDHEVEDLRKQLNENACQRKKNNKKRREFQ
ncbi:protein THEMIS isoform X2 [Narcine bancroftii]|uniref:protein THEMIS isoform X2 n=1 Tax=Narcine bancroftii TaxID=1343680 RepID=UPI003831C72F